MSYLEKYELFKEFIRYVSDMRSYEVFKRPEGASGEANETGGQACEHVVATLPAFPYLGIALNECDPALIYGYG